ncbi:MAG: hypothetical protein HZA14_11985 [Nitrospirae bacterium]|nr:hypothetical protein [Nitrospirota bacterium]
MFLGNVLEVDDRSYYQEWLETLSEKEKERWVKLTVDELRRLCHEAMRRIRPYRFYEGGE